MKRITIITCAIFAMVFTFQPSFYAVTNDSATSIQDLGTTEGKPITNGFVFIDGKYIEPPYMVTRQGNGIYINKYLVEQPCPWPIPEKPKLVIPSEEVVIPTNITHSTTKQDADLQKFIGYRKSYYFNHFSKDEALKRIAKTYASLPCVKSAQLSKDPEVLDVIWANDETSHIRVILPNRASIEWTREKILERTDRDRANYEDRLSKGDYYFLGSAHGRMTGTADGARMVFGALFPILKTSKDVKEVQQRMTQAGFTFFDEKTSEAFFINRDSLKDLESRMTTTSNKVEEVKSEPKKIPGK